MSLLSEVTPEQILIHGNDLSELMRQQSFADMICLLWRGNTATPAERRVIDAILCSSVLHTDNSPSIVAARTVALTGGDLPSVLAAGTLAMGANHGGVVEKLSKLLQENVHKGDDPEECANAILSNAKALKQRIPGYGHLLHPADPRTVALFTVMRETGCYGVYCATAEAIERKLTSVSSRPLPLNITGAIAAAISDLGFEWRIGTAFFVISRMVGMAAHYREINS
ncbi:MAG: citryl-CoA lyase [bacterium]|nr:citryl-CoA lyase [bacterium]